MMWRKHSKSLGIDKERFEEYYIGKEKAIGIEICNIRECYTNIISEVEND
ncbi:hypothetical protein FACS1894159_02220 [Bacteroidia bacterium]|nr:hypothetical protein FACS1894159_02220 [Bacteroidia bacterium]